MLESAAWPECGLIEPEIPKTPDSIGRLCLATGAPSFGKTLGFSIDRHFEVPDSILEHLDVVGLIFQMPSSSPCRGTFP